ncbi:MAG: hypothetical protein ACYC96_03635 [Fimbriimonadaceae bacterium]
MPRKDKHFILVVDNSMEVASRVARMVNEFVGKAVAVGIGGDEYSCDNYEYNQNPILICFDQDWLAAASSLTAGPIVIFTAEHKFLNDGYRRGFSLIVDVEPTHPIFDERLYATVTFLISTCYLPSDSARWFQRHVSQRVG